MTKNNELKIMTVGADKGGVKKTTTTQNMAEWLAQNGYSVLVFDKDRSMNLTRRYILEEEPGYVHNVLSVYAGEPLGDIIRPLSVKENIDLIASSSDIPELEKKLESRIQRELIFFKWISQNYEVLNAHYDYILIDTRNDAGVLTLNSLAAADAVIGITDVSVDGFEALFTLKEKVDELNEAYENEADLVFVVGGIAKGEKATQEILKMLQPQPEYIGAFRRNTNMANPETMFEQASKNRTFAREQEQFLYELTQLFTKIKEVADYD